VFDPSLGQQSVEFEKFGCLVTEVRNSLSTERKNRKGLTKCLASCGDLISKGFGWGLALRVLVSLLGTHPDYRPALGVWRPALVAWRPALVVWRPQSEKTEVWCAHLRDRYPDAHTLGTRACVSELVLRSPSA
jgi:hypothetical protein